MHLHHGFPLSMAERKKSRVSLRALLVCLLSSHAKEEYLLQVSLFFPHATLLSPDHDSAVVAEKQRQRRVAVLELEGKTRRHSPSRFIDIFPSPQRSLRASRHSKGRKKERHAPENISFHIPSSCDVGWVGGGG